LLAYILRDLYPIHKDKALFKGVLRVLVANIPLLAFCILYSLFDLRWYETGSTLVNFCLVALLGGVGVAVTLLSYNIANIPFLRLLRPKR
jgi:putative peptidoglycan lipid II flippase